MLAVFRTFRSLIRQETNRNTRDYRYYAEKGWLESDYYYPTRLDLPMKAAGRIFDTLASVIDGRGVAGDTVYADAWRVKVANLNWSGNQAIYEGAVVYVLAEDGEFRGGYKAAIDGFTITGGDQQGFPNQLGNVDPNLKEAQAVQGGGIFANAYARFLQITNNVLQSNGGAYAGAIRLGTPHLPGAANDNQNDFVKILNNRILANGGTNLAGAVGIFSGSQGYEVAFNDVQESPHYPGGLALRFARVKRYRPDKPAAEADTIDAVRRLHRPAGDA